MITIKDSVIDSRPQEVPAGTLAYGTLFRLRGSGDLLMRGGMPQDLWKCASNKEPHIVVINLSVSGFVSLLPSTTLVRTEDLYDGTLELERVK